MKKFLPLIAIAAMSAGFATVSLAQDAGPRGGQLQGRQGRGMGGMMRMAKVREEVLAQLNLTADQKKKLAELDKKTEAEVKALMVPGKPVDRAKAREVMEAHRDGMKKILTKEQNKKYRELMMAKMKEMRERRQGAGAPPPPAL